MTGFGNGQTESVAKSRYISENTLFFRTLAIIIPGLSIYLTQLHKRQVERHRRELELAHQALSLTSNLLYVKEHELSEIERTWKCNWNDVELGEELGRGGFGGLNTIYVTFLDVTVMYVKHS